jgi:hypothetical protein
MSEAKSGSLLRIFPDIAALIRATLASSALRAVTDIIVISSKAKQSIATSKIWIASSLRSSQ